MQSYSRGCGPCVGIHGESTNFLMILLVADLLLAVSVSFPVAFRYDYLERF